MRRSSLVHRLAVWMALTGYALVASGLPVPIGSPVMRADSPAAKRLAGKDRSKPFPCLDKPCGCASAEQCFSKCCCNTPAELLAWAKANRIDPAVIAALKRRAAAPATALNCCSTAAKPSCCESSPRAVQQPGEREPADNEPDEMQGSAEMVVLRAMLACGGIVAEWLAMGIALPPPPVVACDRAAEPIASLIVADEISLSERAAPESPPPRSA